MMCVYINVYTNAYIETTFKPTKLDTGQSTVSYIISQTSKLMAKARETKGCVGNQSSSTAMLEEFVPPLAWSQDSDSHYLVLDLPGFKKEEVRLQVNNRGEIITSGERQTVGNKLIIRFLQTFKLPENSLNEKITGKFEGEVLYITIPKRTAKDERMITKSKSIEGNGSVENHHKIAENERLDGKGIIKEDWSIVEESGIILRSVVKNVKENKGIVITAALAFSLGMLVSRKLQNN